MSGTKIRQKPKITKKSSAKAKPVGGSKKGGVQHVHGLSRQEKKTAKTGGGHGAVQLPKGVDVREYPNEGKNRTPFGAGVKHVGNNG